MFKIEYEPDYNNKFHVYKLESKTWYGKEEWRRIAYFQTEEEATTCIKQSKGYPKYFNGE